MSEREIREILQRASGVSWTLYCAAGTYPRRPGMSPEELHERAVEVIQTAHAALAHLLVVLSEIEESKDGEQS